MRLLGRLPRETEAHVDRMDRPILAQELGDEDRAVETSARQHRDVAVSAPARGETRAHGSPRYTHPDVHVSRTTTCDSSGSAGCRRSQIQRARTSLVGFSSPSISFR